jgi:uncharacterized protein YyaL (SSP411 family)
MDLSPQEGLQPAANLLAGEASPYLAGHAADPVAWRPWSAGALAEAARLGRPVLLSVGFAACHWCHVMARESFRDAEVADAINRLTVPVKVDREERPDVDLVYQQALERLGGRKGWPLTLLLAADGEALAGGTYLAPDALLRLIAQEAPVAAPAAARVEAASSATIDRAALRSAAAEVAGAMDPFAGGLKGGPKFPQLGLIELLLRAAARDGDEGALRLAVRSLEAMANGGLYDHLDGGFRRYAVDAHWRTPHYEKMLYDNARFVSVLTLAWRRTRNPLFEARVRETIGWLDRRLSLASGAFAASLSAEAGGREGAAQVWTDAEITEALGEDAAFFRRLYDVPPPCAPAEPLRRLRAPAPGSEARLARCLAKLRAARAGRPHPARDGKVLADWNALAIRALAEASLAFGEPAWLARARQAWNGLVGTLQRVNGLLLHARGVGGFLEDYAAVGLAALALHEASGEARDLQHARLSARVLVDDFSDPAGGFRQVERGLHPELPPLVPATDSGVPAGNALALELLACLARLDEEPAWLEVAAGRLLARLSGRALADPIGHAGLLNAADSWLRGAKAAITGEASSLRAAVLALADPAIFLTQAGEGPAHLVVCRDRACGLPVTDPAAVAAAFA